MEVHTHTHTPRRKWTHYFWEFLMLFLAVFAGFLAENQREHYVEHQREKQYMRSMIDDLKLDTAEIRGRIYMLDSILIPVLKKSTELLYPDSYPDSLIRKIYAVVPQSYRFLSIDFQDRTLMQLKNSGNFRLIRNKEVTDSLAAYIRLCGYLNNPLLPGYEASRIIVKEMVFSIFNLNYFQGNNPFNQLRNDVSLRFLSNDKPQFIKLANFISNLNTQASGPIRQRFIEANNSAVNLINQIIKEYHFE